jgi:hypothetical protein
MDYLEQIEKTGAYRFRRGIPAHLRPFFPGNGTVWREHLDTKVEAEARPRCLEVAARVERLFQQAQARHDAQKGASAPPAPSLSMEALTRLVADWKANERSRRAQFVTVRPIMPGWSEFIHEATLTGACNLKPRDEDPAGFMARLTAEQDHINGVIRDIGAAKGLLIDEEHPAHAVVSNLVKKAWVEVLEAEHRWRANDYSDLPLGEPEAGPPVATPPPRQLAPVPALVEVSTAENPLFSVAFEDWVRLGKPAGRTKTEAKTALRQFTEMHGDLPVLSIKKAHARAFRDALAKLPKNLTAEQKKVPLPVLIERATGATRQPQTINKTLNLLGGILSRQAKEGIFDDVHWANPFWGVLHSAAERIEAEFSGLLVDRLFKDFESDAPPTFRETASLTEFDFAELLRMEPDSGTTNVRNTASSHWRPWLGAANRCLVPFTSFSEPDQDHEQTRKPVSASDRQHGVGSRFSPAPQAPQHHARLEMP